MPDNALGIPPPPPGFKLVEQNKLSVPPPPPGFQLEGGGQGGSSSVPTEDAHPITKFAQSAYETGIKPVLQMGRDFFMAPFENDAAARLSAIPGQVVESHKQQFQQAKEFAKSGEYDRAAMHGLSGMIPMIGPVIGQSYEDIAYKNRPAEGFGSLAGVKAIPEAVGKVVESGLPKVLKPFNPTKSPAAAAMEQTTPPIPVGIKDFTNESRAGRVVQNFLQNRMTGREPFFQETQRQNTAARQAATNIGDQMAPPPTAGEPPVTPAAVGTAARDTLRAQEEAATQSLVQQEANRVRALNVERIRDWDQMTAAERAKTEMSNVEAVGTARQQYNQKLGEYAKTTEQQAGDLRTGQRMVPETEADLRATLAQQHQLRSAQDLLHAENLDALDTVTKQIGDGVAQSPEQTGKALINNITAGKELFMDQAREMYRPLDAIGQQVNIKPLKDFLQGLADELNGPYGMSVALKGVDTADIISRAAKWAASPDTVSFGEARDISSALKSMSRDIQDAIPSRSKGVVKSLTNQLETRMQDAADRAGLLTEYKQANAFYRRGAQLYNDSSVADLLRKNPAQASDSLWKPNNVTPIQEAQQALAHSPQTWDMIRRRGVEDLFEHSLTNGELNGQKLLNNWKALGPEVQQLMGGEQYPALDAHINRVAQSHAEGAPAFETSQTIGMKGRESVPTVAAPPKMPKLGEVPTYTPPMLKGPEPTPFPKNYLEKPAKVAPEISTPRRALIYQAERDPAGVANILLSDSAMSKELHTALSDQPVLFDRLRQTAWNQMIESRSQVGVAGGDPILDTRGIANQWQRMSPTQRSLLAGEQLPEVNRLMTAFGGMDMNKLRTLHHAVYGGLIDPMLAGSGLIAAATAGSMGHMVGALGSLAGTAMALIGPKYLGRALTNPVVVRWLTEGLELKPGTRTAIDWAKRGANAGYLAGAAASTVQPQQPQPPSAMAPPKL